MTKFKITRATQKGKSWMATGINPVTGKEVVISGGVNGVKVGPQHRDKSTIKAFNARHKEPITPKQYINKRRWSGTADFGDTISIPRKLFK